MKQREITATFATGIEEYEENLRKELSELANTADIDTSRDTTSHDYY